MAPLIKEFEKKGATVLITTRDVFQTCELLELHGMAHQIIGKHYGSQKWLKLYGILARSMELVNFARKHDFKLALCAGSPYQALAAYFLKIPFIIINDYEHSSIFAIIRYTAHRMFFPAYISDAALQARKLPLNKVIKFDGLKEEIYLGDFRPDENVLQSLKVDQANIVVILRPPASEAHYHNPKSDRLMLQILETIKNQSNTTVIVMPRGASQRQFFLDFQKKASDWSDRLVIPDKAIDTLSLLYHSDLMLGGGGTMNREAVALGLPTYSFFCGPVGEVDRYLQKTGKLHFIQSEKDISKIRFEKRKKQNQPLTKQKDLKLIIIDQILESLKNHK
jgi:hypothetical protein